MSESVGLGADLAEATFTKTVRTKLTVVEVAFTASARVNFLFEEVDVEREEDNEYDADTNHALCYDQGSDYFGPLTHQL